MWGDGTRKDTKQDSHLSGEKKDKGSMDERNTSGFRIVWDYGSIYRKESSIQKANWEDNGCVRSETSQNERVFSEEEQRRARRKSGGKE